MLLIKVLDLLSIAKFDKYITAEKREGKGSSDQVES